MAGVGKNIAKAENKPVAFSEVVNSMSVQKAINNFLSNPNDAKRFTSDIISVVTNNPTLKECDPMTVISSAMQANALGLATNQQLGQCYLVPFNNKKKGCKDAQFQIGYKGYIQLAIRSGQYKKINVVAIKQGELVRFDPLTEDLEVNLIEDGGVREKTPTIGYYAMFEYTNGFRKALYWSKEKMEYHADLYSMAFDMKTYKDLQSGKIPKSELWKYSSFWYKDFDAMAFKTMLRQLISKWGIMSIDMQNAITSDNTVISLNENNAFEYVERENDLSDNLSAENDENVVDTSFSEETGEVIEEVPDNNPEDDFFSKQ